MSIDHSKTKDTGLFVAYNKTIDAFDLDMGLRYDDASVESREPGTSKNDYDLFGGHVYGTWHLDEEMKLFGGFGVASRVPDGKELYFKTKPMKSSDGTVIPPKLIGNPDLNEVTNYQIDLGVEKAFADAATVRVKAFYSMLDDFIFYDAALKANNYVNQDATLYGVSLDGTYAVNDVIYFDGGISYLRGKKDDPLPGQTDDDMPNIPPLKAVAGVNWDYADNGTMRLSMVAASGWNDIDEENGEQEIGGYAVFNFQIRHDFLDHYELTLGVDNIFDKAYSISNTYKDQILVTGGLPMILNEPGRYIYGNLTWHF
jgi:iron complex outermembrane receptor protein